MSNDLEIHIQPLNTEHGKHASHILMPTIHMMNMRFQEGSIEKQSKIHRKVDKAVTWW